MSLGLDAKLKVVDQPVYQVHPADLEALDLASSTHSLPDPSLSSETQLRTSSYVIYVDLPEPAGDMLLVHGYTGSYDKVSRSVATYLRSLENRRTPKPLYGVWRPTERKETGEIEPPSDATLEALKERGYLTTKTVEQEEAFFTAFVTKAHRKSLQQMPIYILMPTYDCNLRCAYCFQDHMRTDPRYRHLLRTMTPEVVDTILAALPTIEDLHGVDVALEERRRSFILFGGEPLLKATRPLIEHILTQAQAMSPATFTAISNGTELHHYRDLLSPSKISCLQITLDGPPEQHDQRRIYADGSGSFKEIAESISLALDRGVQVDVRMNIDRTNIDELPTLASEIRTRGWDSYSNFSTHTAPIHAVNENVEANTTMNTWELDRALSQMRDQDELMAVIGRPDDGLRNKAASIFKTSDSPSLPLKSGFCGAHDKMYVLDPFLDIYACWERTGDSRLRIGRILENGEIELNEVVQKLWRTRTVASNPACRKCRYALNCGGGCAVLAQGKTGRYHANFCDAYAKRFRGAVAEAYLAHLSGSSIETKVLEKACT